MIGDMDLRTETIDQYIELFPPEVQAKLRKLRELVREVAPQATESISYGIPTFKLHGNLVHFGAFPHHISFFPAASGIAAFKDRLSEYKTSKGTVQFAPDQPIPYHLLREIVAFRVKENSLSVKGKK